MTKRGAKYDPSKTVSSSGLKLGFPTPLNEGGDDTLTASNLGGAGAAAEAAATKHPKSGQGKLFIINRYRYNCNQCERVCGLRKISLFVHVSRT